MSKNLITYKQCLVYLKVNASILDELIKDNNFQITKKGNSKKLNKDQIDQWINNLTESEQNSLAIKRIKCRFTDYIRKEFIFLDFEALNKFDAIAKITKLAREVGIVQNHRWLNQEIVSRENIVSTAMGKEIAFLHTRASHPSKISKSSIILVRSKFGIDFGAIDEKPVKLFFLLLLKNEKEHLFSLSYLNKILLCSKNTDILKHSPNKESILEALLNPKFEF